MLPSAVHLLPTPSVADGTGGHATRSGTRSGELLLPGVAKAVHEGAFLTTPTSQDSVSSGGSKPSNTTLTDAVVREDMGRQDNPRHSLLPTPTASPYGSNRSMSDGASRRPSLNGLHREQSDNGSPWGKYAPALERWERTIHRKPPLPTEPGKKGGRRLSPKFVEWMQGLPAGHVTDVPGISRNDQLKALGNGVVPQQVATTTRAFLEDTGWSL